MEKMELSEALKANASVLEGLLEINKIINGFTSVEKPLNFDPFGHARFAHLFVLYD